MLNEDNDNLINRFLCNSNDNNGNLNSINLLESDKENNKNNENIISNINKHKNSRTELLKINNSTDNILQYFKKTKDNYKIRNIPIIQKINKFYTKDIIKIFNDNKLNNEIYKILVGVIKNIIYYLLKVDLLKSKFYLKLDNSSFEELVLTLNNFKKSKFKEYFKMEEFKFNKNKNKNFTDNNFIIMNPEFDKLSNEIEQSIIKYYYNKILEKYNKKNIKDRKIIETQIFYIIYIKFIKKMTVGDLTEHGSFQRFTEGLKFFFKEINKENGYQIFNNLITRTIREIFMPSNVMSYYVEPNKTIPNIKSNKTVPKISFVMYFCSKMLLSCFRR